MKRLSILVLTLFTVLSLAAQATLHEHSTAETFSCGYQGEEFLIAKGQEFRSNSEAEAVVNDIVAVIGIRPNFSVQAAKVDNAAALVRGDKQYLLYNPAFIQSILKSTHTNWSAISIMAHEVGHHLNGHTLKAGGSRPEMELEADEFSGFVLRKMGATLEEAQIAMKLLASDYGSATHPAKYQRLQAIQNGWNRAEEYLAGHGGGMAHPTSTTAKPQRPQVQEPVSHPAFATYRVTMSVNPSNLYYLTTQNNFVAVKNGQVYVLGKLKKTGDTNYPYSISVERSGDLMVAKNGELFTVSGKSVGFLSKV